MSLFKIDKFPQLQNEVQIRDGEVYLDQMHKCPCGAYHLIHYKLYFVDNTTLVCGSECRNKALALCHPDYCNIDFDLIDAAAEVGVKIIKDEQNTRHKFTFKGHKFCTKRCKNGSIVVGKFKEPKYGNKKCGGDYENPLFFSTINHFCKYFNKAFRTARVDAIETRTHTDLKNEAYPTGGHENA